MDIIKNKYMEKFVHKLCDLIWSPLIERINLVKFVKPKFEPSSRCYVEIVE